MSSSAKEQKVQVSKCNKEFQIWWTEKHDMISKVDQATRHNNACKEQLPAPGNRSNERRYREKDLATTEEKKVGTGEKREGDEKSRCREK
ncbi:hypothetical protein TNCV_1539551 [Trichonephila clavipes]|nr:hypothetical protein TNCV_1539551 [Trichonephila clavipes]